MVSAGKVDQLFLGDLLIERPLSAIQGVQYLVRDLPTGQLKVWHQSSASRRDATTVRLTIPDWSSADVRRELDTHVSRVPVTVIDRAKVTMGIVMTAVVCIAVTTVMCVQFRPKTDDNQTAPEIRIITSDETFQVE